MGGVGEGSETGVAVAIVDQGFADKTSSSSRAMPMTLQTAPHVMLCPHCLAECLALYAGVCGPCHMTRQVACAMVGRPRDLETTLRLEELLRHMYARILDIVVPE